MPGRLFLARPDAEIAAFLRVAAIPPQQPRRNIAPGQDLLCLTAAGPATMRWGMIPVGRTNARGRPVLDTIVNAQSETVFAKSAFAGTGRGIVAAEGWYEWTGERRKKTAWAIRPAGGGLLAFAAITDTWVAPGGRRLEQLATVTCEPNAEVGAIHHRMGVLLDPADFDTWLTGPEDAAAALMKPPPDGTLTVGPAGAVNWEGP